MDRHLAKWKLGQSRDPENNCHHLMAVAWGCIVLYMYERWAYHTKREGIHDMSLKINVHVANDDRPDKLTDEEINELFDVKLTSYEEQFLKDKAQLLVKNS